MWTWNACFNHSKQCKLKICTCLTLAVSCLDPELTVALSMPYMFVNNFVHVLQERTEAPGHLPAGKPLL